MATLRVLIAGGGIAGLTLAHGLRRAGIDCEVFEREPREGRRSGYRLTLDADGGNALEACLPAELYERYLDASHRTPGRPDVAVVIDSQCRELTTAPHIGPPNGGERPHTAIDRGTFRQILSSDLAGVVHYEAAAAGFAAAEDGVELRLADGRTAAGDVLVAADGVGSAIRRQLMPEVEIVPAPVGALGLFGRSPLTDDILAELPEVLSAAFVIARDDRGVMLSLGQCVPRRPGAGVASPYMQLSGGIAPGTIVPAPAEWTARHPARDARGDARGGGPVASGDPGAGRSDRARVAVLASVPAAGSDAAVAGLPGHARRRRDPRDAPDARQGREHGDAQRGRAPATSSRPPLAASGRCSRRSAPTRPTCARPHTR